MFAHLDPYAGLSRADRSAITEKIPTPPPVQVRDDPVIRSQMDMMRAGAWAHGIGILALVLITIWALVR